MQISTTTNTDSGEVTASIDQMVAQVKGSMKKLKVLMYEDEGREKRQATSVSSSEPKREKTTEDKFRSLKTALANMVSKLEKLSAMKEQVSSISVAYSIKEELIDILKEFEEIATLFNALTPIMISKKDSTPSIAEEADGMEVDMVPVAMVVQDVTASSSSSSSAKTYADLDKLSEDYLKELDAAYNTDEFRNHNPNVNNVNQKCVLALQEYSLDDLYKKYQHWNKLSLEAQDWHLYSFFNTALISQCCQKILVSAVQQSFDVTKYDFSTVDSRGANTSEIAVVKYHAQSLYKKWFHAAAVPEKDKERFRFLYNTIASLRSCGPLYFFDETWRNLDDMKAILNLDVAFPREMFIQVEKEKCRASGRMSRSTSRYSE